MSARCTFAHVDLAALQSNFRAISAFLAQNGPPEGGPYRDDAQSNRADIGGSDIGRVRLQADRGTPGIIAVVKANAYGHGAPAVARALQDAGAKLLACADIEEAVVLRKAGVTADILIFGALGVSDVDGVFEYNLTPTISTPGAGRSLQAAAAKRGIRLRCHLKIDTGMNRLGLRHDNLEFTLPELITSRNLEIVAVYTHFATADDPDHPLFQTQRERFEQVLARLPPLGVAPKLRHAANSAATLRDSRVWYDLVRPGLMMYGVIPPPLASTIPLTPVMSLHSRVVAVKGVRVDETVGYGGRWTVPKPGRIAVVPAGYADGLDRRMAGTCSVLIRGKRAPIVGAVNMDMITVDVSDVTVDTGDEVVIIGRQQDDRIEVREIAGAIGTNPWEVLSRVGARIERIY
ncbi:MAG TPA: alanine racemase [Vicinamibacterales bacterium]|nr:alanine racemase [Vicinamibacterales bacterium]